MLGRSRLTLALSLFCWLGYGAPAAAQQDDNRPAIEMSGLLKGNKWRTFLKKYCDGDKGAIKKFAAMKAKMQERRLQLRRCSEEAMGSEYSKAQAECGMSPAEDQDTSDKFCEDGKPRKLSKEDLQRKKEAAKERMGGKWKKAKECLEKRGVKPPAKAVAKQKQCFRSLTKKWHAED